MADQYKSVNGKPVKMTATEIEQMNADRKKWAEETEQRKKDEIQFELDQKTGNKKLLDLGLTQAEATALTGYTPVEENEE
tara:strand:- start:42 stop:281 length:240 start_codon:yes stop_codon:yes gene_type:complete